MSTDAPTDPAEADAFDRTAEAPAPGGSAEPAPELLRVVKGAPSAEEIAALSAVVAAAASNGGNGGQSGPLDLWGDRTDALDGPPRVLAPRAYQSGRFGGR